MNTPTHPPEDLRAALINHPKAMISTDDNYPTIIQIPLDDLLRLCEAAAQDAWKEGYDQGYGDAKNGN